MAYAVRYVSPNTKFRFGAAEIGGEDIVWLAELNIVMG